VSSVRRVQFEDRRQSMLVGRRHRRRLSARCPTRLSVSGPGWYLRVAVLNVFLSYGVGTEEEELEWFLLSRLYVGEYIKEVWVLVLGFLVFQLFSPY